MAKYSKGNSKYALLRILAAMLASVFALCTACRNSGVEPAASDSPIALATPTPSPAPVSGGKLILPIPVNAPYSDPLSVNTEEMLNLFSLVYDNLINIADNGELVPALAESWINEGNGVWQITLRQNVYWHDSSGVVTAQDVINTYNSIVSLGDSCYYYWCASRINQMELVDERTVKVTMNTIGILSLYALSFPIRKSGDTLNGTGAYKLSSMTDDSISLTINTNWWDRAPYIEEIEFKMRDSNETALASYEAGQLNMTPTALLTAGKYAHKGTTNVLDIMTQGMETLLFNHNRGITANADVRRGIAHGINRSRIITNVYMNRARASDVPMPSDYWLYDSRSAILNYSTDTAIAYLEAAGFGYVGLDGIRRNANLELRLKLLTSATTENTTRSDAASMIASQLAQIGIAVEIVTAEHILGSADSPFISALSSGDWDIALCGFNMCLDNDLTPYLTPGGERNYGNYSNPAMTELINAMRYAETEEALREAATELQLFFVEQTPFITLYFRLNSIVYSADISGIISAREPRLFAGIKDWYIAG